MQIIPATQDHFQDIVTVYNWAIEHTTSTFDTELKDLKSYGPWISELMQKSYPIYSCLEGDQVVGFGLLKPFSNRRAYDQTCELSLYILPSHQGKGLGLKLMDLLIDDAKKISIKSILSKIEASSLPSVKLHSKVGFETVGTMQSVGYKFDRWLDVIIMQKLLS